MNGPQHIHRDSFEETFKALFRKNFGSMCIFAERYLIDTEQSRDVVHDVFSHLWQHPEEISGVANVRNYIYAVVRNRCIDMLRRRELHSRFVDKSLTAYRAGEAFFETETIREDVYSMLESAIRSLPERSREIITLKLEGYKNREIGEKLNISVNTVNTLKTNAYKALRDILQNDQIYFVLIFLLSAPS